MEHANLRDRDRSCHPFKLRATRLHANPPVPGRRNPEPDQPSPPGRDDENEPLPDEDEAEHQRPGRDEHARAWL